MNNIYKYSQPTLAFLIGVGCAVVTYWILQTWVFEQDHFFTHSTTDYVHVHADFLVILDQHQFDFSDDKYQSHRGQEKHRSIHLHANNGHVIHRHEAGITLGDFFSSLGFLLTDNSIITDEGVRYETTDTKQLMFFVNNIQFDSITDYVIEDEDKILIYFGEPIDSKIEEYLATIPDDACLYSGTCPERGTAPPTDCGITCDVFDATS